VGSVTRVVAPASLRPYLIDAVERGMQRALAVPPVDGHAGPHSRGERLPR
jgi:hypothetical protein